MRNYFRKQGTEVEESGDTAAGQGERRPSLVTLQSMLKKVSHSPFHSQYNTLVSSDTSGSSANDSRNQQDVDLLGDLSAATSDVTRDNQESGSKGRVMEGVEVFSPPTTFQSPHLDFHPHLVSLENGSGFAETEKNLFQTSTNANNRVHDATLSSPDLFKPVPAPRPPQRPSLPKSVSLSQAAKGEDLLRTEPSRGDVVNLFDASPRTNEDPFKSPPNNESDLFPSAAGNPFHTSTTNKADLFQAPLSRLSTNTEDPFPSPITRDLFQDVSTPDDPFGSTPSKQYDPFRDVSVGTPDVFQPLPSNGKDVFEEPPSSVATFPTPLPNGPAEPPAILVKPATPPVKPRSFTRSSDLALPTNQDTDDEILPANPFTRARNLSMSPSQSLAQMNHVRTIRRPPKPVPRSRPARPENPPTRDKPPRPPPPANLPVPEPTVPKTSPPPKPPVRPLPKPVPPLKPKTPASSPTDPENHVFEDVLLIGQEKCVEDWPEDSPELKPNFKPSGTLRLRRESLKTKTDSDGGSGEDADGSGKKKRDKRHSMSRMSRRGSKEKFADNTKERKSSTLPPTRGSSKEYFSDLFAGEKEDDDNMDYKKNVLKTKVTQLIRRASTSSSMPQEQRANGRLPQDSKGDYASKKGLGKENSIVRRWSEGGVLDASSGEEEEEDEDGGKTTHQGKKKKKMKIKFVPQRGFAITVEKTNGELKGAQGYTPRKGSKDMFQDEDLGAHGFTPRKKSQDYAFEDVEEIKAKKLQTTSKAALMDEDEHFQKTLSGFEDEDPWEAEDLKPKKQPKPLRVDRRSSKDDMYDFPKKKGSFSAEELDEDELDWKESGKAKTFKHKAPVPVPRKPGAGKGKTGTSDAKYFPPQDDYEDDFAKPGKDFMSPDEMYDSDEDELDFCKAKKQNNGKKLKSRKTMQPECEDPPGAAGGDFLSEAARAEWIAAKMDEQAMADEEEDDEGGDTDSLMEWWNTVEQWDEMPSDEEDEDESESFSVLADKVTRGLRVFNKIFMERAEALWHNVISLHAIADDISSFHHKAKIAGITGGTTTAVGGVTAIAGLALAPVTMGISLLVTAVGVGVATAGGITSASAAISDNVNNMHDRKKVELVLEDYETHLLDLGKILHFVNHGLYKLRGHPFLRSGTQHYSEDWEIRRAVQMISLVDKPVQRAADITDEDIASVQGLFRGMDKYFIKETRELKKGCKKEVVAQIKEVATILNDGIVELNTLREELQDATGSV